MYAPLIDETGRVIDYFPTTYELLKVEAERPKLPEHPKRGKNYTEYWDKEKERFVLKEEDRPLTLEEIAEEARAKADAALQGLIELSTGE